MEENSTYASATSNITVATNAVVTPDAPTSAFTHVLYPDNVDIASCESKPQHFSASDKPASAPASSLNQKHTERMSPATAAEYLGIKESTLAIWRCTRRYKLPYIKVGRLVQYRKSDLDAFLLSRIVEGT